jgi:hypothetical protein
MTTAALRIIDDGSHGRKASLPYWFGLNSRQKNERWK